MTNCILISVGACFRNTAGIWRTAGPLLCANIRPQFTVQAEHHSSTLRDAEYFRKEGLFVSVVPGYMDLFDESGQAVGYRRWQSYNGEAFKELRANDRGVVEPYKNRPWEQTPKTAREWAAIKQDTDEPNES